MTSFVCLAVVTAEILWTKPICKEADRYIGWPTVCARGNGELVVVFSGDRDGHVCPFGKVQLVRSGDGGETWSVPVTIRNSCIDDRDAGVLELRDGTLLVNSFSSTCFRMMCNDLYRRIYEKIPNADICRDIGYWSLRSTDGGRTWEAPVRMRGSSPHGGIQLKDGRLLHVGRRHNAEGNMADSDPENVGRVHELPVEVSADEGRSWQVLSRIGPKPPYVMTETHEPHVVELDDGTLLVHIRYHGDRRRTVQCESRDGGRTWSDVHETGIPGFPSFLLKMKDGRLLSTYARRDEGHYGEYAVLSSDGGKSWDNEHTLLICGHFNGDLGYPSTVQLFDGSLVTVFYQADKSGEPPCVMATKWRLNDGRPNMLYGKVASSAVFGRQDRRLQLAFDFLRLNDLSKLSVGRHAIDGDDVYVNIIDAVLRPVDESCKLEAHRKYIDIHVPITGTETIGCAFGEQLVDEHNAEFDVKNDCVLLAGSDVGRIRVNPGEFVVFYPPYGAHAPGLTESESHTIRKAVIKVACDE